MIRWHGDAPDAWWRFFLILRDVLIMAYLVALTMIVVAAFG